MGTVDEGGYLVTDVAGAALAVFGAPGVRHVAALDDGTGLVAFDGLLPDVEFSRIVRWMIPATHPDFWPWAKVRRHPPMAGAPEHFALVSASRFRQMVGSDVLAATLIAGGDVLVMTPAPIADAVWQASAVAWRDVRVPLDVPA